MPNEGGKFNKVKVKAQVSSSHLREKRILWIFFSENLHFSSFTWRVAFNEEMTNLSRQSKMTRDTRYSQIRYVHINIYHRKNKLLHLSGHVVWVSHRIVCLRITKTIYIFGLNHRGEPMWIHSFLISQLISKVNITTYVTKIKMYTSLYYSWKLCDMGEPAGRLPCTRDSFLSRVKS